MRVTLFELAKWNEGDAKIRIFLKLYLKGQRQKINLENKSKNNETIQKLFISTDVDSAFCRGKFVLTRNKR